MSFFTEILEGEGELAKINVLERDQQKVAQENIAERTFEDEDIISDGAQLELLRKHHSKDLLLAHLSINSVWNKLEELSAIIKTLCARIMFIITETKIDASYPNAQFSIPGYSFYRNERKKVKRGGGIMALISTVLVKTRLKLTKN